MPKGSSEEAFVKEFVANEPALRSFILSQVGNWADMKEILQQTSVVLWRKFDQFEEGTNFKSWAFKIARFEVLNHLKKQRRSKLVFCDETLELLARDDSREEEVLEMQRHALNICLQKLEPEQREILAECYEQKQTIKEVARKRRRTLEGLYKMVQRMRASLLKCVEREMGAEGYPV
ncbi:MAG: sigma-70 family RNA polymerase sigma factor [Verrucomicrobiota bacterium]